MPKSIGHNPKKLFIVSLTIPEFVSSMLNREAAILPNILGLFLGVLASEIANAIKVEEE